MRFEGTHSTAMEYTKRERRGLQLKGGLQAERYGLGAFFNINHHGNVGVQVAVAWRFNFNRMTT